MMTRKDYVSIAAVLRQARPQSGCFADDCHCVSQWRDTVDVFVGILFADNPRFDEEKFLIACGVEP